METPENNFPCGGELKPTEVEVRELKRLCELGDEAGNIPLELGVPLEEQPLYHAYIACTSCSKE